MGSFFFVVVYCNWITLDHKYSPLTCLKMHLVVSVENMSPFPRGGRVFVSAGEVATLYKF